MPVGAPLGNDNGLKIKDPDLRQQAYDEYCAWLARGKSSRSFSFVRIEDDGSLFCCTGKTIESYIKNDPIEFPPFKKEVAFAQGMAYWEEVVDRTADGSYKDSSVPALNMLMRNKYGWDKQESEDSEEVSEPAHFEIAKGKNLNADSVSKSQTSGKPSRSNSED